MLKVNYEILPGAKRPPEKSIGAVAKHNSFYDLESHAGPNLAETHCYADNYFGFQLGEGEGEGGASADVSEYVL